MPAIFFLLLFVMYPTLYTISSFVALPDFSRHLGLHRAFWGKKIIFSSVIILLCAFSAAAQTTVWMAKCGPALHARLIEERENSLHHWFTLRISDWAAWDSLQMRPAFMLEEGARLEAAGVVAVRTTRTFLLQQVLPQPCVQFADVSAATKVHADTDVAGHNLALNRIDWAHRRFPNVDGRRRIISIKENRFDTTDIDLRGRIAPPAPSASPTQENHASIMATLAAGAGNGTLAGRGVAYGARVSTAPYGLLLPETDIVYTRNGISVQNHSYGGLEGNYYGNEARAFDQSVQLVPHLVHVFSVGNAGTVRAGDGRYRNLGNWATLTGNFKMAKNTLTVGAVNDAGTIMNISSRGPAYDGRLKPDLCAVGKGGTSEAAAITSGVAALVQQVYADQHSDSLPPTAWVRALLTGTTLDRGTVGPDYVYGFGLLDAERALQVATRRQYRTGYVQGNSAQTFTVSVPPNADHLRIALAWDDVPAEPTNTRKALIRDLDLEVTDPQGRIRLPLVNNPTARLDSLAQPARPQRDTLNTIEQVWLSRPEAGIYTITVRGDLPVQIQQAFAMVWDVREAGTFEWIQPLHTAEVGETLNLYWNTTLPAQPAYIEWKAADAPVSEVIGLVENVRDGHVSWVETPKRPTRGQFRLVQGARSFWSDTVWFVRAPRVQVGYRCADSTHLFWRPTLPQARYRVLHLGARYLEPLLETADTAVVVSLRNGNMVFAIQPILPDGELGVRSAGTNVQQQGVGCYLRTFLVQRSTDGTQALGNMQLGTTYGLRAVVVEKETHGQYVTLQTLPLAKGPLWTFTDEQLHAGINRYRARIELSNGQQLYTDYQDVLATGEQRYWVFPNPLTQGQLQILWEQPVIGVLYLHDAAGKLCLSENLKEGLNLWDVSLPNGIYFYQIHFKGQRVTGKVLVAE